MKTYISILMGSIFGITISSCEKKQVEPSALTSVMVVNTVTGGSTVRVGAITKTVVNNASSTFTLYAGSPDIYVWPITDSTKPYYNSGKGVALAANDYWTLFLTGTSTAQEGIMIKDSYQNYSDSVAGIRFINLSPNSTPVNVTLSTSTATNEFSGIVYKQNTDFKKYPAASANASYTYQVRSAASPNTVIASITMSGTAVTSYVPRFKNVTLVFKGNIGGTGVNAPTIVRVNHY